MPVFNICMFTLLIIGSTIAYSMTAHANTLNAAATLKVAEGLVEVQERPNFPWAAAENEQLLRPGSAVRTGKDGKAIISTRDGSGIQLNSNSLFVLKQVASRKGWVHAKIDQLQSFGRSIYQLFSWKEDKTAELWIINDNRGIAVDLETETVRAGLRGTSVVLKVEPGSKQNRSALDTSIVSVLEGRVVVSGLTGPKDTLTAVARSQERFQIRGVEGRSLAVQPLRITPGDAVQWTLYIPPLLLREEPTSMPDSPTLEAGMKKANDDIEGGNLAVAEDLLLQLAEDHPEASAPYRLLATVQLALNRNEEAMRTARLAVKKAPHSPAAAIVMSYAHQALFDLPQARQATMRALSLDPGNKLALLNLARLQFGEGDAQSAWQTLETVKASYPGTAEIHNLRGFVRLAQRKTKMAIDEFERATKLNNRLGEPHLGLGLAHMRLGETENAFKQMATAVLLEPQRSLFHSYWGKMLHQVKNYDKALDVLDRARSLDPQDPTPELYKAIVLKDLNRPGEAVRVLNNAIALNGNRAVYRSTFLLDQDLAARNVDMATLYSQLGLDAWARNKALTSIKADYTNFDGHLFYAGSLRDVEGRAYTFNSETLLARLMQPANINTFNNFNNYTSLFEQPGVQGSIEGLAGSDGTYGINGELSGVWLQNDLAFNLGGSYAETDGWRHNLFERERNLAGIVKWQPTMTDGLFADASVASLRRDDAPFPRYESDTSSHPDDQFDGRLHRFELGYHRKIGLRSNLLLYLAHLDREAESTRIRSSEISGNTVEDRIEYEQPYFQGQAHYSTKMAGHQLMLGTMQYRGDKETSSISTLSAGGQIQPPLSYPPTEKDISFETYYLQDIWQVNRLLTLEVAAYYDRMQNANPLLKDSELTIEGFNPRLGIIVRPTARDTFRLAAFHYITPFFSSRLDPTEVAGIQVFRNTAEGSENSEVAIEWNHEWQNGFATIGGFYLEKDIEDRIAEQYQDVTRHLKGNAAGAELEYNQLLTDQVGFLGGYRYFKVDDDIDPRKDPLYNVNRDEHLFRAGLRYMHPDGYIAGISQTYRHINSDNIRSDDTAAITDLELAYQFPGRRGRCSLEVYNLFDNQFNWVTDPYVRQGRAPGRQLLVRLSINF